MFFCSWCPYIMASSCTLENYAEEGAGSRACAGLPMIVFTPIVSSLWGTWHNTNKNDETWYLWDAHHVPGGTGRMVQRPMSEVRENELLSPATFFFFNRCVIALGFPSGFPGSSDGKNLPIMQESRVPSLGREDPLEKETATHLSILTWRIPWTEEPGGL